MRMPFYPWRNKWWKNFQKKKILKAFFLLYISPSISYCKTSDSPKKETGLVVFISKCGVVKTYNDVPKLLLILWSHPKCAKSFKNEGESTDYFFLEVSFLRCNDDYFFVSWTFILVTYSFISQKHCKNGIGLYHPFLVSE